jgi:hypothetical protein
MAQVTRIDFHESSEKEKKAVQVTFATGDGKSREVWYSREEIDANLCLAYACTVHKAQGSEYDVVVIVLDTEQNNMLRRSLLYTAMTRARKRVYIVGSEVALKYAVHNNDMPLVSSAARDGSSTRLGSTSAVRDIVSVSTADEVSEASSRASDEDEPRRWTSLAVCLQKMPESLVIPAESDSESSST